jgi:hypothetical protein
METGFKNVEVPGPKCRKVAKIKQQGHRTAILKQYELPDNCLTVRFFCNITPAVYLLPEGFKSSELILTPIPVNYLFNLKDPVTDSSLSIKLQKTTRFCSFSSVMLLGKSNNTAIGYTINSDFSIAIATRDRTLKNLKNK